MNVSHVSYPVPVGSSPLRKFGTEARKYTGNMYELKEYGKMTSVVTPAVTTARCPKTSGSHACLLTATEAFARSAVCQLQSLQLGQANLAFWTAPFVPCCECWSLLQGSHTRPSAGSFFSTSHLSLQISRPADTFGHRIATNTLIAGPVRLAVSQGDHYLHKAHSEAYMRYPACVVPRLQRSCIHP